jgi:hypothetical protein
MAHSLHLCIGLLVLLVASFSCAAAAEEKQPDNAATSPAPAKETNGAEVLGKLLDAMLGKDGKLGVEAVQALRALITKSTEKMDGVIRGVGYRTLDVPARRERFYDVPPDFLIKQLTTAKLFPDCADKLSPSVSDFLQASLEKAREFVAVRGGAAEDMQFAVQLIDGRGQVWHVAYGLSRLENGNYSAYRGYLKVSFAVDKDYLVVYKSTKSRTWYELVPLQPQLTQEKMNDLFAMDQFVPPTRISSPPDGPFPNKQHVF